MITKQFLQELFNQSTLLVDMYYPYLAKYMSAFHIDTPLREAAFLAQIGHESGRLHYNEEIADGSKYEGRTDLGNISYGDGRKYKGRGLIQLTGKYNYEIISRETGIDFLTHPELLSTPENAVMSACWYWNRRNLNQLADQGLFREITQRINGGQNGADDRLELYNTAKYFLGI